MRYKLQGTVNATFLVSQAAVKVQQAAVKVQHNEMWSKLARHRNTEFYKI